MDVECFALVGKMNLEAWGIFLTGVATLITAAGGLFYKLTQLNKKLTEGNQSLGREIKDHMESQVRKMNGVPMSFINNLPIPVWAKDVKGKYLWINQEYASQWDVKPTDFEGKSDYQLWPQDVAEEFRTHDLKVIHDKATLATIESVPVHVHDSLAPMRKWAIWKFPILSSNKEVIAVGGIAAPYELEEIMKNYKDINDTVPMG